MLRRVTITRISYIRDVQLQCPDFAILWYATSTQQTELVTTRLFTQKSSYYGKNTLHPIDIIHPQDHKRLTPVFDFLTSHLTSVFLACSLWPRPYVLPVHARSTTAIRHPTPNIRNEGLISSPPVSARIAPLSGLLVSSIMSSYTATFGELLVCTPSRHHVLLPHLIYK